MADKEEAKHIIIATKFSLFFDKYNIYQILSKPYRKRKNQRRYNIYNEPHKQELIIKSLYHQYFVLKEQKKKVLDLVPKKNGFISRILDSHSTVQPLLFFQGPK